MTSRTETINRSKRDLDRLDYERMAGAMVAMNPSLDIITRLSDHARNSIPGMASLKTIQNVYQHNPDTLTVYAQRGQVDHPEAFTAILPLTEAGTMALFDGTLDTSAPSLEYVCRQYQTPHSVYIWALFAPPRMAGALAALMERLSSKKFARATIYCKAASLGALKFIDTLGFVKGSIYRGVSHPEVLTYNRNLELPIEIDPTQKLTGVPLYDSYVPGGADDRRIGIKVVHSMDELLRVHMIRAATYLAEQDMPFEEDLDRNDLSGSHLIGYVGDEPAGCVRIRYFAGFAKLERLSVIKRFRNTRLAFKLVRAAIELGRTKGYTKFYGQAEAEIAKLWMRFGFVPREGDGIQYLTNRKYLEGDLTVDPHDDPLTPSSEAYVLLRPEGQWHVEGTLEQNASY